VGVSLHPAALPIDRLLAQCEIRRTRRSGPGGQHRNKVETAVCIEHRPTGISAEAGERRSQVENRAAALFRLRLRLAVEVRCRPTRPYSPSPVWQSRCHRGKVAASSGHDDFPAILAEALDVVAANEYDVKAAAASLECTASQLTRLLQQEPRAFAVVNQARERQGLHRLK
jgi:peptide chain release factor-like protein